MTVLAQGGTGSPPAGGGELSQVIFGTIGAMIVTAGMFLRGRATWSPTAVIFLGLYGSMGWGLALLQQRLGTRAVRV